MNFRMTIGKVKPAGTAMIIGRRIRPRGIREFAIHSYRERPIVYAVWILVNKDPHVDGRRDSYLRNLHVNPPRWGFPMSGGPWNIGECLALGYRTDTGIALPTETPA